MIRNITPLSWGDSKHGLAEISHRDFPPRFPRHIFFQIIPVEIMLKTNLRPLLCLQSLNNLATHSNLVLCIIEIKKCLSGPYCWMASDRVIAYATNINRSSKSIIFNASHRNNNCSWQHKNLNFKMTDSESETDNTAARLLVVQCCLSRPDPFGVISFVV